MRSLLLALLTWLAALAAPALAQSSPVASVASPDGRVRIDVTIDGEGWAQYAVSRDGKPLIAPSRMGFQFSLARHQQRPVHHLPIHDQP